MLALFIYLFIALGFSFFCSVAEAVLLSVSTSYITLLEQQGRPVAGLLRTLRSDIDTPLAAILSLNTIAHTVGVAGVGAQAAFVFGNAYLGLTSAILTLLILIFSEIIPKTLGTYYWRQLAPPMAHAIKFLVKAMYPLVWLAKKITGQMTHGTAPPGFNREEFAAMAHLGQQEGELSDAEARVLQNVFKLREARVADVMTPANVMFALPEDLSVDVYNNEYTEQRFTRIPIYRNTPDHIVGFVLRGDLLVAQVRGNATTPLLNYRRDIAAIPDRLSLLAAFDNFLTHRAQIMQVVDEYGTLKGVITLEDVIETLVGLEIVDESDLTEDMQILARRQWRRKAQRLGIDVDKLQ